MDRVIAMHSGRAVFAAVLVCVTMTSGCESTRTSLGHAYMHTSVSGDLALAGPTPGSLKERRNSLRRSLRLDDARPTPLLRASIAGERTRLDLSGFWTNVDGTGELSQGFGDLPAGTRVRNDLTFANLKAILRYDLLESDHLTLAPGAGLDYFHLDIDSRNTAGDGHESVQNDVVVPMFDLLAGVDYGKFGLAVEAGWMQGDLGDADGTYWDLDGTLRYEPADGFALMSGYRWIKIDANGSAGARAYESNLEVSGWFVGGEFSFGRQRTNRSGMRSPSQRRPRPVRKKLH